MTATTAPAAPAAAVRVASMLPLAEVALALVSVATVAGMWRLFVDGSYFGPLAAHALAAHALAALLRRRGVPTLASAAITLVAAALALSWAHLGDTLTLGLPTGRTLTAGRADLTEAWRLFDEVRAPAPVLPGFLLAAGAALWVGAWLADLAAFRLWTSVEALIPAGTVFVFASLFSAERSRALAAAVWFGAAILFALLHGTARQHASPSWLGSDPRLGSAAALRVGAGLAAAAVVGALVIGPNIPGAGDAPVVAVRDLDDGGSSRQTVSPLVEIRGRLIEQSQTELFTVRATRRAYWRLTSLDVFDGEVWSSRGTYGDADGELSHDGDAAPPVTPVQQRFAITDLAAIWLPAAFEASDIDPGEAEVRWEAESSTLIVSTDFDTSDGLAYEVTSEVPTLPAGYVAPPGAPTPDDVLDTALELPPDFPPAVTAEAQRIVAAAGATDPMAMALALQASFRNGSFTYSLDVPAGHSDSAIEEFLFVRRSGYCEQFAGTYAAMARAVGLPARVAVGFTPGELDPGATDLYHVRGEHAHAWPEVWIPGAGWTAFEPTPGRGAPFADYTGVPEAQDTAGPSTEPEVVVPATTPTTAAPAAGPGGETTTTTAPPPFEDLGTTDPAAAEDGGTPWGRWLLYAAVGLAGVMVVTALAGAAVAGARAWRRWRRWAAASSADAKVRSAWADAVESAGVLGVAPRRHETRVEFAVRAEQAIGEPPVGAAPLAFVVDRADYGGDDVSDDDASDAVALAAGVRTAVHARTTRAERVLAAVDPRPPDRRRRGRSPRPTGPRIRIARDAGGASASAPTRRA